jgi:ribonucleoside-diphosphate reductase alpha chain
MNVEQWLGKDNTLGVDIWKKKYQHNKENFDEWLDRISNNDLALRNLILEKKFLFGGRILANRGLADRGKKITYSNCYVNAAPLDSIESIFDCGKQLARTYSYGGGCGISISKLRPNGAKVNNAAESTSGATSFLDFFSMVTEVIGQSGRRKIK